MVAPVTGRGEGALCLEGEEEGHSVQGYAGLCPKWQGQPELLR